MEKNWWAWVILPAAATTGLLAAVTVITAKDEEPSSRTIATSTVEQEHVAGPRKRARAAIATPLPDPAPPGTTATVAAERLREAARVPELYGLTSDEAIATLEQAGFRARIRRERSFQPDGLVFEQMPRSGRRLRKGRTVFLTVSVFPSRAPAPRRAPARPVSAVPRVVGLDYWEAAARMELLGVVANLYPGRSSRSFATVIRQEPAPGTRVRRGSHVRLVVSLGNYPLRSVRTPDTVGLSERMAHSRCRDAYLTCRTVLVAAPEPSAAGRVVRQWPPPGQVKQALTQMRLSVGR